MPKIKTDNITRCTQNGWHAYMAGPCFSTHEQATSYRNMLDARGMTWKSQDAPWPPIPKRLDRSQNEW